MRQERREWPLVPGKSVLHSVGDNLLGQTAIPGWQGEAFRLLPVSYLEQGYQDLIDTVRFGEELTRRA